MSDFEKMQTDAVNRAKEMYSRRSPIYSVNSFPNGYNGFYTEPKNKSNNNVNSVSKSYNSNHSEPKNKPNNKTDSSENKKNSPKKTEPPQKENSAKDEFQSVNNKNNEDIFDSLFADKERTLIILLIVLLSEEKASTSLVLALMYLIM